MYLCIIYGIVIMEIYSYNKELYTYKVAYSFPIYHLSMCRLENLKMSVVYCGAPIYMLHLTPDNSKTHSHSALPYMTWGLLWDSKIKKKESIGLKFSTRQASEILNRKIEIPIENFLQIAGKSIFQIQTTKEGFEVENSASRERSSIHRRRIILPLAFKNHQIQVSGTS